MMNIFVLIFVISIFFSCDVSKLKFIQNFFWSLIVFYINNFVKFSLIYWKIIKVLYQKYSECFFWKFLPNIINIILTFLLFFDIVWSIFLHYLIFVVFLGLHFFLIFQLITGKFKIETSCYSTSVIKILSLLLIILTYSAKNAILISITLLLISFFKNYIYLLAILIIVKLRTTAELKNKKNIAR